jgi:hypothetical protein
MEILDTHFLPVGHLPRRTAIRVFFFESES